jgi:hypothetical protein
MVRIVFVTIFACALLAAPAFGEDKDGGFKFRTDPQIKAARTKKPVRIKLKRGDDGKYTWEITGESTEDVLRADEELKKKLGVK